MSAESFTVENFNKATYGAAGLSRLLNLKQLVAPSIKIVEVEERVGAKSKEFAYRINAAVMTGEVGTLVKNIVQFTGYTDYNRLAITIEDIAHLLGSEMISFAISMNSGLCNYYHIVIGALNFMTSANLAKHIEKSLIDIQPETSNVEQIDLGIRAVQLALILKVSGFKSLPAIYVGTKLAEKALDLYYDDKVPATFTQAIDYTNLFVMFAATTYYTGDAIIKGIKIEEGISHFEKATLAICTLNAAANVYKFAVAVEPFIPENTRHYASNIVTYSKGQVIVLSEVVANLIPENMNPMDWSYGLYYENMNITMAMENSMHWFCENTGYFCSEEESTTSYS